MRTYKMIDSPLGALTLTADDGLLSGVYLEKRPTDPGTRQDSGFGETVRQLEEYFAGERTTFELQTLAQGNNLQRRVWKVLGEIPYGETRTYGEVAEQLGLRHVVRAVGAAIGQNPLLIVVPCHRVIAAGGRLGGYGGSEMLKRSLLVAEGLVVSGSRVRRFEDYRIDVRPRRRPRKKAR